MSDAKSVFRQIIEPSDSRRLAVFDLDSTLYNVSVRTKQIVLDFTADEIFREKFKGEIELLQKVDIQAQDWGLKESIVRSGIILSSDLFKALRFYWATHFFSSHYLQFDMPYKGAAEYVQALNRAGVHIKYLTGRDSANMKKGTILSLENWGFPLKDIESQLIMKPHKGYLEDEDFKSQMFDQLNSNFENIWFFENEPLIIHKVMASHPHIKIIWIDTTHSRRSSPPKEVFTIQDQWEL